MLLCLIALVITVFRLRMTCTDFADHHCAAFTAKQTSSKKIIVFASVHRRGFFIVFKPLLNIVKRIFIYNRRNSVGEKNIAEFIFADIFSVCKDAKYRIVIHIVAAIFYSAGVHQLRNFFYAFSFEIKRINFFYNRRERFVYLIFVVAVDIITERSADAVCFGF